jgi:DNA polymerase
MREAAAGCQACDLWRGATQTVFGEGPRTARAMLVGEQPGDREDREGHPFVGPAGAVLDRALERSGLAREKVYVTNVVKHFRYRARGKRRIHQRPDAFQIAACRPWLEAELDAVRPEALVCLGATAAQALVGRGISVTRDRGVFISSPLAPLVTVTVHPSSILRSPDEESRHAAMEALVADLAHVAEALRGHTALPR